MKIKKLQLYDFGIYAGENSFNFSLDKPVVLIGGMNGRGKTTFLEAVVLCLYGSNSPMYKESGYKTYGQYLRSLTNRDSWTQQPFVELTFLIEDSAPTEYTIHREWDANSRRVSEIVNVSENGAYSEFLTNNWSMFIENIIPSALSSFYFFDGEKIAELALDESNMQLKEAIRSMLGLNVLDVLKNDLHKMLRRRSKQQSASVALSLIHSLKDQQEKLEQSVKSQEAAVQELHTIVKGLQEKLGQLQHQYESKGGKVVEQRAALIRKRAELTTALEQLRSELINSAASELPLRMVKDLILEIKLQAEDEHNELVMQLLIERIDDLLREYLLTESRGTTECERFVEYIKERNTTEASMPFYQVSDFALFQLNNLLDAKLDNAKKETVALVQRKKKLQAELDAIESHLSLDINEDELSRISVAIKNKQEEFIRTKIKYDNAVQELNALKSALKDKGTEVNETVSSYLKQAIVVDENARMDRYTHIALKILDAYSVRVQSQKSDILAATITKCFHKLANKQQLIDRITVNPESLEITYLDCEGKQIFSNMLSAGEKQLMVISVLWALATCSKKQLPVIIDTPLSRLDSAHRASVVQNYFPHASAQTMILSTDSEIDRTFYELIKDSIGDEFTLRYDESTRSTTILKGYFAS